MKMEMPKKLAYQKGEFVKSFREKRDPLDKKLFIKILEMGGISRNEENITPSDLFSIPKELTGQELLDLVAKSLDLDDKDLEKNLEKISECFRDAKNFLNNYLLQEFPKEIQKIEGFKNLQEFTNFLKKTRTLRNGEPMTFSPIVCALTLVTLAEWEYRKENFKGLKGESEYIDRKLFKKSLNGISHFHEISKGEDEDWSNVGIFTDRNKWINALYSYRGKGKDSLINKILQKPELTAKEVVKDGIGLKFEVKTKEDALELMEFLAKNIQLNFETKKLFISNIGELLDEETTKIIANELKDFNISFFSEENKASHKNFQALKLEGEIRVPENGEEGRKLVDRNFEIQIVLTNNKNETGLAQHSIYKRVQKLSSYTRIFGSFSENYLDLICEEAGKFSGLGVRKIKKYITEKFLIKISTAKTKKPKFASKEQILRWQKAGFLPKDILFEKKK